MSPPQPTNVIDWDEAMEQCGDDEDFLRELLGDLRSEATTQLTIIDEMIRNPGPQSYNQIMRASHVIKGAAANLMCEPMRVAALELELCAKAAASATESDPLQQVLARCQNLQQAVEVFAAFLQSIGV